MEFNGRIYNGNIEDIITEKKPQSIPSNTINMTYETPPNIKKIINAYDFLNTKTGNSILFGIGFVALLFLLNLF